MFCSLNLSSADNFCEQFEPRSDLTSNIGPYLDPKCLMVFSMEFLKLSFFKKNQQMAKWLAKFPSIERVMV